MLIINELYAPMISTIPGDTSIFSILNPDEEISKKVIMENYINFYCFQDLQYDFKVFRFENFMDYESIDGLERCFMPFNILKKHHKPIEFLIHLLNDKYVMLMPVDRQSISFYKGIGTHEMLVYGVNTTKELFYCKDYKGHQFVKFEVSFSEVAQSVERYYRAVSRDSDGILAFRIKRSVIPIIDYSKVYMGYHKLGQEFFSERDGYGIGAIDFFIEDVKKRSYDYILNWWWYVTVNFVREAAKLTNYRYRILKKDVLQKTGRELSSGDVIMKKLSEDTNLLYGGLVKVRLKESSVSEMVSAKLIDRLYICKEDYKSVSNYFCTTISDFKM